MPLTYDPSEDDSRHDPLDQDMDDSDDLDATVPCPSCGKEIYEDADQCPHCGEWIIPGAGSSIRGRGIWIVAAVLAILGLLLFSVF